MTGHRIRASIRDGAGRRATALAPARVALERAAARVAPGVAVAVGDGQARRRRRRRADARVRRDRADRPTSWFAAQARRWLAFPFTGIPARPDVAAGIFLHNLRALAAVGGLLLIAQSAQWTGGPTSPRVLRRPCAGSARFCSAPRSRRT